MGRGRDLAWWAAREATEGPRAQYDRFTSGAKLFARGGRGVRGMRAPANVGGEFFHGPGDRKVALGILVDLAHGLEADIHQEKSKTDWITSVAQPTLNEFSGFAVHEWSVPLAAWVTEWSTYQAWYARLVSLRDAIIAQGITVTTPEPPALPTTIFQRAETGRGSSLDTVITAAKGVLYGSMAIIGLASMVHVVRSLKDKPKAGE